MLLTGQENTDMTPTRPYMIRAMHDWISDNELTPYLLVNANQPNLIIPQAYVDDGKIILNISAMAVRELDISNRAVTFNARFDGVVQSVYVSMAAVMAIYAKENGRGMAFDDEYPSQEGHDGDEPPPASSGGSGSKGYLKVVK